MRKAITLSIGMFLLSGLLLGQFKVSGNITDANSGDKLVGANVIVEGTESGTSTDVDGNYSLTVPAGLSTAKLTARYIGYKQATVTVTASGTQDFSLKEDVLKMDAVMVTGVAGALTKTKTPFAIDKIDSDVLELAPATTVESMIRGKSAGVKVVKATGEPGYGASVQLRGATSINASGRSQAPLYIIDGIIIDPSISGSPMGDISPDDVQSIEIIKGAAGASEYGARAANGVIAISTKRGSEIGLGQTRFNYKMEQGYNQLNGSIETNGSHFYKIDPATGYFIDSDSGEPYDPRDDTKNPEPNNYSDSSWANGYYFADQPYKYGVTGEAGDGSPELLPDNGGRPGYNHVDRFFSDGNFTKHSFSMMRNEENFNVFVSLSNHSEDGVFGDFIDGFNRNTFRLNTDVNLPYGIKLGFSSLLSKSLKEEANTGSFFDITFFPWDVDILKKDPDGEYYIQPDPRNQEEANPVYQIDNNERLSTRDRAMLGSNFSWSITPQLKAVGSMSFDRSARKWKNYYPKGWLTVTPSPNYNEGNLGKSSTSEEAINGDVGMTYANQMGDMDLIVRGRYNYESYNYNYNSGSAWKLAVGDVPQLETGEEKSVNSSNQLINSDGGNVGAQIDFKDRYIVDVTLRQDRSSLFGPGNRVNNYYKFSGAYRMSEEGFWGGLRGIFPEFKVRFSTGTAGVRPAFSQQYETWSVAGGNISKSVLGNNDLKPQTTTETEFGIDFSIMDRVSVEFTQSSSTNEDQLLPVPLAGFYGYSEQWQNAGTLEADATELSINASVINTRDMSLTLGLNWDKYDQQITEFNMPAYLYSAGGPLVFYMKNKTQYASFWGTKWTRETSELPADDLQYASQFQVNDEGFLVWVGEGNTYKDGIAKTLWGKQSSDMSQTYNWGRPIQYVDPDSKTPKLHQIGTSVPDFGYAFNANFRFKGLTVYTLFDGQSGGNIYNRTRQWGAREAATGDVDQYGKDDGLKKPTIYYRDLYHVNAPNDFYVEDASYLKLRELAVKFNVASLIDMRGFGINGLNVGIVGRNLITWTDYRGYDPEVGRGGGQLGSAVNARVDSYTYPNYRTFSLTMDIDF
ncbi:MAG: SusC/RagA family TonB-linked outer membrane protein [Candidatus Marinimicrobia bacterium]|nr:SusC/RagA family TonB-linked outer membrane protein [Candidatus Neomarinimicrobiota bacterium]